MSLILSGFKKSGKSTLGKILAEKLALPFIDTDLLVEKCYLREMGKFLACNEIHKEIGEKSFRELEKVAIGQITSERVVIATGGGVVIKPENVSHLKKLGIIVYLEVNKEVLWQRIIQDEFPSFLDAKDPRCSFEKVFQEREKIYKGVSDIILPVQDMSKMEIVDQLLVLWS